jgi:hypothetical protein
MLVPAPSGVAEFLPSVKEWCPEVVDPKKLLVMEKISGYWILFRTPAVAPSALRSQ